MRQCSNLNLRGEQHHPHLHACRAEKSSYTHTIYAAPKARSKSPRRRHNYRTEAAVKPELMVWGFERHLLIRGLIEATVLSAAIRSLGVFLKPIKTDGELKFIREA